MVFEPVFHRGSRVMTFDDLKKHLHEMRPKPVNFIYQYYKFM